MCAHYHSHSVSVCRIRLSCGLMTALRLPLKQPLGCHLCWKFLDSARQSLLRLGYSFNSTMPNGSFGPLKWFRSFCWISGGQDSDPKCPPVCFQKTEVLRERMHFVRIPIVLAAAHRALCTLCGLQLFLQLLIEHCLYHALTYTINSLSL